MPFYVYILQSESTSRYYVGHTEHLEERVRYHQSNYSKSIKNRGPWKLRHFEEFPTRGDAMKREHYIKRQKDRRFIEKVISASR
jgi:putative endonuclease